MLALTLINWPFTVTPSFSRFSIDLPMAATALLLIRPSRTMINSSPPKRHTMSLALIERLKTSDTDTSNSSPKVCPFESFMFLKSSKSINNNVKGDSLVALLKSPEKYFSSRKSRFGNPVKPSWKARCLNRSAKDSSSIVRSCTTRSKF